MVFVKNESLPNADRKRDPPRPAKVSLATAVLVAGSAGVQTATRVDDVTASELLPSLRNHLLHRYADATERIVHASKRFVK